MNPLVVLGLLFLLVNSKKEPKPGGEPGAAPKPAPPGTRTSPPGVLVPEGGLIAPAPAPAPTGPAPYNPPASAPISVPSLPANVPTDPLQAAASEMLVRLVTRLNDGSGHGAYRKADMIAVYMPFQRLAGIVPVDGLPGKKTMTKLSQVLSGFGVTMPPSTQLPIFAWTAYDGVNGPRLADWNAT